MQVIPQPIYPVGEFPDGSRLCVSVGEAVDFFPEHRDFDLLLMDEEDLQRAPTVRDLELEEDW